MIEAVSCLILIRTDWLLRPMAAYHHLQARSKSSPGDGCVKLTIEEQRVKMSLFATHSQRRCSKVKLIISIIQPSRLEAVKEALTEVEVFRLTVLDCQGFGRQKGHTAAQRYPDSTLHLLRKVQLQIAVNDEFVEPTVNAVLKAARTGDKGQIGDGKVFVLPMDDCIRIRTGERGPDAI